MVVAPLGSLEANPESVPSEANTHRMAIVMISIVGTSALVVYNQG